MLLNGVRSRAVVAQLPPWHAAWWRAVRAFNIGPDRKKLKEAPLDPKVYRHLQRLNLGWVGAKQKHLVSKKDKVPPKVPEAGVDFDPAKLDYFRRMKFRQTKRALRKEKRKIMRQAATRYKQGLPPLSPRGKESANYRSARTSTGKSELSRADQAAVDASRKAQARWQRLFRSERPARYCCALSADELPRPLGKHCDVPEVAIAGRSNVGKSTLLNALLGMRSKTGAAAVDDRPGATRSLDFYRLGHKIRPKLVVVDMPGYGFAFGNEERVQAVQALTLHYLRYRGSNLKRFMLLLDARHGLKHADRQFLEALYSTEPEEPPPPPLLPPDGQEGVEEEIAAAGNPAYIPPPPGVNPSPPKLQVVLTKCDLLPRDDLARRVVLLRADLNASLPRDTRLSMLMVSASSGLGVDEVKAELTALIRHVPEDEREEKDENGGVEGVQHKTRLRSRSTPTSHGRDGSASTQASREDRKGSRGGRGGEGVWNDESEEEEEEELPSIRTLTREKWKDARRRETKERLNASPSSPPRPASSQRPAGRERRESRAESRGAENQRVRRAWSADSREHRHAGVREGRKERHRGSQARDSYAGRDSAENRRGRRASSAPPASSRAPRDATRRPARSSSSSGHPKRAGNANRIKPQRARKWATR